ncbi:hypothetical protein [Streptomyces sp. XD-27]|uniref:DUF7848 domain-containing protein n=1 Tax=Streptomyces sp. XD-27 TaxID=3062779 RepID=UPI0026F45611|nr:hypothetical protein [Streptomyces sp. XD-27]WKX68878.1 hypothetical protein Q3Y56_02160 [Streptomyces sp. XD-27]
MTRKTYRFREYVITPDTRPEAEPHTYAMTCTACHTVGPRSEDMDEAHAWAARHLKANPEHLTYREHITRPYLAKPGKWL